MAVETDDRIAVKQEDAARMVGVTSRTFRTWEKKLKLIAGHKVGGVKLYAVEDLRRLVPEKAATDSR